VETDRRPVEADSRRAEVDSRQAEADRRRTEVDSRQAEADSRQAEADRRRTEVDPRQAEADSRQAEADPRRVEADSRRAEVGPRRAEVDPRRAEVGPRRAEVDPRRAEADPRRAEADPRRAEVAPRRAEVDSRRVEADSRRTEADHGTDVTSSAGERPDILNGERAPHEEATHLPRHLRDRRLLRRPVRPMVEQPDEGLCGGHLPADPLRCPGGRGGLAHVRSRDQSRCDGPRHPRRPLRKAQGSVPSGEDRLLPGKSPSPPHRPWKTRRAPPNLRPNRTPLTPLRHAAPPPTRRGQFTTRSIV